MNADQTCGNCAYRGEEIEADDPTDPTETIGTGYFLCGRAKMLEHLYRPHPKGEGAFVKDGSGYFAALCVETDFACNRWAPKT